MSFGRWHEEQKAAESPGGGGGGGLTWFSDLANSSGEQLLPLYEGMQPVSFQNIKESMEASMPKKIMGMNYQQRFKVGKTSRRTSHYHFSVDD